MIQQNNFKKTGNTIGMASSLYMALAYLSGIIIFIFVLRYPEITDGLEKVKIVVEMKSMFFITNLFMYVLFGPVLILYILYLRSLTDEGSFLVKFSSITGIVWAGSLTASGMVANAAIPPVLDLYSSAPAQAEFLWQIIDTVSVGLGNGNGEVLGGIMTLGFGAAMLKGKVLRGPGVLGIAVGAVGLMSVIPALGGLTAVFGILQLVWFVLTGFARSEKAI